MENLRCLMCAFVAPDNHKLIIHILSVHQHDSSFKVACMFPGCKYKSSKWMNFTQHCRRQHGLKAGDVRGGLADTNGIFYEPAPEEDGEDDFNDPAATINTIPCRDRQLNIRRVAQFLLALETRYRVSRTAVQAVWHGLTTVFQLQVETWKEELSSLLFQDVDTLQTIFRSLNSQNIGNCPQLATDYLRQKFYRENFFFIEPRKVLMPARRSGKRMHAYFVPLQQQLEVILSLPEMQDRRNPVRDTGSTVLRDFSDGTYCKFHELRQSPFFVQVILSYDSCELQNPLRSNKSHNLAFFYISLGNIPPRFRSKLRSIFLLGVARSMDLKNGGLDLLLADFIRTMTLLRTSGIQMTLPDGTHSVKGDLIAVLCDTPAAAFMGGFKETMQAYKLCRMCHANKDSYSESFRENDFQLRTMPSYLHECEVIESAQSPPQSAYFSKAFGINRKSCLAGIPHFPVTGNILQDPMHCLLEGAFSSTLALLLQTLCLEDKLFTLDQLNDFLQKFPFSSVDRHHKPFMIEKCHVQGGSIKQKAATMLMLTYILPFFFGRYTTNINRHYNHYLTLTKIVHIAFSPESDGTTSVLLANLIEEYCLQLPDLYPHDSVKPKCHFLTHFPSAIREFGALRNHSTMRFEGKHGWFKQFRYHNFTNLPMTVAFKHQLHLAYELTTVQGKLTDNFFTSGDEIAEGTAVDINDFHENLQFALRNRVDLNMYEPPFYVTPAVTRHGRELRPGLCICLKDDEFEGPTFAILKMILVVGERDLILCMQNMLVDAFDVNFNAYQVSKRNTFCVQKLSRTASVWPLPIVDQNNKLYITNRFSMFQSY
jgi:hypothetical protein